MAGLCASESARLRPDFVIIVKVDLLAVWRRIANA
jgi:hypothetical protein